MSLLDYRLTCDLPVYEMISTCKFTSIEKLWSAVILRYYLKKIVQSCTEHMLRGTLNKGLFIISTGGRESL